MTLAVVIAVSGLPHRSQSWIVKAYANWERGRFIAPGSILQDIDVIGEAAERISSQDLGRLAPVLAPYRADVLLVTPDVDPADLEGLDIPIWRLQFGRTEHQHAAPGLWEVVERSLSSVSLVESTSASKSRRVLETIVSRTDPRSWIRNQLRLMAKASDLLGRWIPPGSCRAQRTGREITAGEPPLPNRVDPQPSQAVPRLLVRFGNRVFTSALKMEQWQLAFDTSGDIFQLHNPEVLTPPPDRYWCDPFLLQRDGVLHVFIEEYLYASGKGHISVMSKLPSAKWSGPIKVLERPYHLSYPSVFEYERELLMLPETTAAGRIELYRCLRFPDQWELDTVLVENFPGADATLWFQDGHWWLFVDVRDELYLLYAASPRGPWQQHPCNPVKSDARSSRPAGRIFRYGQNTIRPSQDCSLQYGREVVFNKITRLNVCEFEEVEIGRLQTPWRGNIPCHTFNKLGDITVVDRLVMHWKRWLPDTTDLHRPGEI